MQDVRRLGYDEATVLISGARKHAAEIGVPMCIAVADESGNLIAFAREDGAKVTSISIAIDKAFTAAGARNHTSFYAGVSQPGGPAWGIDGSNGGHFTAIGGGVHILEGEAVVGGVGVSGGNSEQDHEVAMAAVEALATTANGLTTRSPA